MNVLVADDDSTCRKMISKTLRNGGYNVMSASDGESALDLFNEHDFQVVVTDWMMPRMNGVELCRSVRKASLGRYVYCIIVSSRGCSTDIVKGFAGGGDDYLAKPLDPRELLLRVGIGRRVLSMESANLTIFALAKLAETRDPETGAHLERVQRYCRVLAECLSAFPDFADVVNHEYVDLIYRTSPLHDIGKVAIPDHILLKPGRLSDDEFEIMKTHTTYGAKTIEAMLEKFPAAAYLQMAKDIVLTHHEKWDGSGYPAGLAGKQIPVCGRIMAVADVYDALTSRRVYKDAFSHACARAIVLDGAGSHFDPAVVEAFIHSEHAFVSIASSFGTSPSNVDYSVPLLHR